MTVADHVQKVMKPNFAASWDEIGPEMELEDTYALSTMKTMDGEIHLFLKKKKNIVKRRKKEKGGLFKIIALRKEPSRIIYIFTYEITSCKRGEGVTDICIIS